MTIHVDPLMSFIVSARNFPMLTREREQQLATRWREHEDPRAARELATSHIKLVVKVAAGFRGYGLPLADLVQEGNVGLMEGVKRFDPKRGVRFSTYCTWWIRAPIYEYILESVSIVPMGATSAHKKLFFKLRKLKARLRAYEDGDLAPEHVDKIAHILGVSKEQVIEMNRRFAHDASLNELVHDETGDSVVARQDQLIDPTPSSEEIVAQEEEHHDRSWALRSALNVLNPRERRIFEARRLFEKPLTLETLGDEFGISKERTRQIENRAFKKVQAETHRRMMELTPRRGSLAVA